MTSLSNKSSIASISSRLLLVAVLLLSAGLVLAQSDFATTTAANPSTTAAAATDSTSANLSTPAAANLSTPDTADSNASAAGTTDSTAAPSTTSSDSTTAPADARNIFNLIAQSSDPDPDAPKSSLIRRAPAATRQSNASDLINQSPTNTQRTSNDFSLVDGNLSIFAKGIALIDEGNDHSLQISLLIDGEVHTLRNSRRFIYRPDTNDDSPINIWKSNDVVVQVVFSYPADELFQISLILNNVSNREIRVGARLLFDTILIEEYDGWFESNTTRYDGESELIPDKISRYIASTPGDGANTVPELVFVLQGEHITIPSKVVLANWERLHELPWHYRVVENRSFTNPPYRSVDSGIALYYDPTPIGAGKQVVRQALLSTDREVPFNGFPIELALSKMKGIDIEYLLRLLEQIEQGLELIEAAEQGDGTISDDSFDQLEGTLNDAREQLR